MIKLLFKSFILLASSLAFADGLVIDIPSLAGSNQSAVVTMIGKPASCSDSKYGEKCFYQNGNIEIVFIDSKADWITLHDMAGQPFSKQTLAALGMAIATPSFSNEYLMRWEKHQGLLSVSLFPTGQRVDYIYIKAFTP